MVATPSRLYGNCTRRAYRLDAASIKKKFDLVEYVRSTRRCEPTMKGVMARCVSPEHDDSNPSMLVTRDSWYCFGCRNSGDSISFVMLDKGVGFVDALKIMDEWKGAATQNGGGRGKVTIKREISPPLVELIEMYHRVLMSSSRIEYLFSRGLTGDTIERFVLGYGTPTRTRRFRSPRFTIPVYDQHGNPVTVRYRLDPLFDSSEPKYIVMPRTTSFLFNTETIQSAEYVVYTGSQIDAMLLEQHGIRAVGSAGEGVFRPEWGKLFGNVRTVILLDNDKAGEEGSIVAWLHIPNSVIVRWPSYLPAKYDVNEAILDKSFGIDGVRRLIDSGLV